MGKVDYVFHLASPASPVDYLEHGIETLQVGSLGTINCAGTREEVQREVSVWRRLRNVTAIRWSIRRKRRTGDTSIPIGPRSVYDEAKRFAEAATMAYHRYHKVDTRIVRIFNTYGPRLQIERWPRGLQFHESGAARRRPHRLWRRKADAQLLLRER